MKITDLKREDYEEVEVNSSRWLSLDNLKNEYWKDIKGFEELYQVSNYGRVKGLISETHNIHGYKERILKVCKTKQGYYRVGLCKNGKQYQKLIHRLVAIAFIPKPLGKHNVDHDKPVEKDYCNNCVYNLRWATQSENIKHCIDLDRFKSKPPVRKGKDNNKSKPVIQFDLNNNFVKQWWCVADIERERGYYSLSIRRAIYRKNNTYRGYKWKYGIYEKER